MAVAGIKVNDVDFSSGQEPDGDDADFITTMMVNFTVSEPLLSKLLGVQSRVLDKRLSELKHGKMKQSVVSALFDSKVGDEALKALRPKITNLLVEHFDGNVKVGPRDLSWDVDSDWKNYLVKDKSITFEVEVEVMGERTANASVRRTAGSLDMKDREIVETLVKAGRRDLGKAYLGHKKAVATATKTRVVKAAAGNQGFEDDLKFADLDALVREMLPGWQFLKAAKKIPKPKFIGSGGTYEWFAVDATHDSQMISFEGLSVNRFILTLFVDTNQRSKIVRTTAEIKQFLQQAAKRSTSAAPAKAAGQPETRKHPKRGVLVEVTPGKFGFSAWVVSKQGKRGAPISIPNTVKTIDEAFDAAFKTVDRIG